MGQCPSDPYTCKSFTHPPSPSTPPPEQAESENIDIDVTSRRGGSEINLETVIAVSEEDIAKQLDREVSGRAGRQAFFPFPFSSHAPQPPQFPDANMVPSVYDVLKTCMTAAQEEKFAGAGYSVGDWVEVQGPDSQWTLTYVKRIIKQAPDEWDWNDPDNEGQEPEYNFYYNCGEYQMLEEERLRSPQEGLRRIFGMRPWIWRSYALLRYENFVRFQKNHENDFNEVDAQQYARNLWVEWLKDPRNGDFAKRYEEVGEIAQREVSTATSDRTFSRVFICVKFARGCRPSSSSFRPAHNDSHT